MSEPEPTHKTTARHGLSPVKWRHSMYFRVLLLCCVLLSCLLAAIFIIVRHTIDEAVREVESKSNFIVQEVNQLLVDYPQLEREEVAARINQQRSDTFIQIEPVLTPGNLPDRRYFQEYGEDGSVQWRARIPLDRLDMTLPTRLSF